MTKVTIPVKASKEQRKAAIDEAVKAKKEAKVEPTPATPEPGKKPAKPAADAKAKPKAAPEAKPEPKPSPAKAEPKPAADVNMLTVSDVARELGLDPKAARAKLRRDGSRATEGRWPKVKRDSKEHAALIALLQPDEASKKDADEDEDVEESTDADDESNDDADEEEDEE